ncbi:hypothetical protein AK812_SmicGene7495 [Symbiodinium microadriaticum]|uniref:Sulfotransferase n=1 Tax=Symbiodinium microadriaticum TaxID=2951 RepID=A0A1Q9ENB8_SYMMI|nr:hypothetical protein AK812_SmicGene7495 [Symbiodinium microadriaticum]
MMDGCTYKRAILSILLIVPFILLTSKWQLLNPLCKETVSLRTFPQSEGPVDLRLQRDLRSCDAPLSESPRCFARPRPFIVVSIQHSGTTWLQAVLNDVPQVLHHGELLLTLWPKWHRYLQNVSIHGIARTSTSCNNQHAWLLYKP